MAIVTQTAFPEVPLIDSDGEPLETPWHLAAIVLLIDSIRFLFRGRSNYFVGGNMFLYFSREQARNRDYRGPDFFYVDNVDGRRPRRWWAVWEEDGRYPDVIMELLSNTTAKLDRTVKKRLYERTFCTPEYFCYEPETEKLEGWRLGSKGRYQTIRPDKRGWLWCEGLQLWVGRWSGKHLAVDGVFPRFYDAEGHLIPTAAEEAGRQAETEKQRAETEKQRAEIEKQRADQAEAQLTLLKAQVAKLESRARKSDA